MGLFVTSVDQMYGLIMTLCHNNCLVKHIPWTAFKMTDLDWVRVVDTHNILGVHTYVGFNAGIEADYNLIGFKQNSGILLLQEATDPLVCSSHS